MSYALLTEDLAAVQLYPATKQTVASQFGLFYSNATQLTAMLEAGRIVPVQPTARPADSETYTVQEGTPEFSGGQWQQVWNTVALDPSQQTDKLNSLKLLKWQEVRATGDGLRNGTFQVGTGEFDLSGDGFTRLVLMGVVPGARTVPIGPNAIGVERYFNATAQQVADLVADVSAFIDAIAAKESALRDSIEAATTLAELAAIDTTTGWPANS